MPLMRTTLTLDPDVARMLEEEVHRQRKAFKEVVNDALRRGLAPGVSERAPQPYRLKPHRAQLLPGFDRSSLNRLVDETEDQAILAKHLPRRSR